MRNEPIILSVALPTPLRHLFDYLPPAEYDGLFEPGMRIMVPFQKRQIIGVIIAVSDKTTLKPSQLKTAIAILDTKSIIAEEIMTLISWASHYYHHPLGDIYASVLPALLRQGKALELKREKKITDSIEPATAPILTPAQQAIIIKINADLETFQPYLLHGVTGSGKTEVYFCVIEAVLKLEKQVLVLVPEIALTPQTLSRFQARFTVPIATLHSGLSDRERLNAWYKADLGAARIIIGTRSAIFTPIPELGLIIIDEEHDGSYKQQDGFRYHARDIALVRANKKNIPIILGSATPSLESQYNVKLQRYQLLELPERAGNAKLPEFHIVDIRNQWLEEGLSNKLLAAMKQHLDRGGQVLIFLNRRGFAPNLICHQCGWAARCRRCDANLILHHSPPRLHCHHCGANRVPEKKCPDCANDQLMPVGLGTERIELALQKHFPDLGIARIDRDTVRKKGSMQDKLADIHTGRSRILIGTQMLAKGHHFPEVNFVAILDADSGFFSADLRASERIGQLLLQVAGRAGRAEKPGEVWIQTRQPNHPLLLKLLVNGYSEFSEQILNERQQAEMPPYSHLALIRAEALQQALPLSFLQQVQQQMKSKMPEQVFILGPLPALMERKAGRYRAQLLIQSKYRNILHPFLNEILAEIDSIKLSKKVRWSLDVDPLDMF